MCSLICHKKLKKSICHIVRSPTFAISLIHRQPLKENMMVMVRTQDLKDLILWVFNKNSQIYQNVINTNLCVSTSLISLYQTEAYGGTACNPFCRCNCLYCSIPLYSHIPHHYQVNRALFPSHNLRGNQNTVFPFQHSISSVLN